MQSPRSKKPVHPKALRKQRFVDPKVQGALILRVILYWVACLITLFFMLLCWRIVTGPGQPVVMHVDDMWFYYVPAAVASLLLLPMVIVDIVQMSNRFVGPLLRLRRSMRALTRGERVEPIAFRSGDFWADFAKEFNQLAARVQDAGSPPNATESTAEESETLVAGTIS